MGVIVTPFQTFKGYYVFDLFPLWSTEPNLEIEFPALPKLSGLGRDYKETRQTVAKFKPQNRYQFQDRTAIKQMIDFFDLMIGRLSSFWIPSWQKDIKLTSDIGASDTTINITDIDYDTYYPSTQDTGRYLFFYVRRGKWFARQVTAVPSGTQLTIESALGEVFSKNNMVCFLYHVRFDIDTLELEYRSP